MTEILLELAKIFPQLKDAKTFGAGVFLFAALSLAYAAHKLSKKTTDDFKAAAKRIESEKPPALPKDHTIATLKLELETMRVRMERAEWAAKEWQLQHVKTQAELNQTAAELSSTREALQELQLEADQRNERQLAADTEEHVRPSRTFAIPPLPPKKKPRQ